MSQETPDNFLGLPPEAADPKTAAYAVLPVPYDATASFLKGTAGGPQAIIKASQQVELFDEELGGEFYAAGVATMDAVDLAGAAPTDMHERVFLAARPIVDRGQFLIGLGGEHSVTSGLIRAAMTRHRSLSILQIDAHLDLRNEYDGTPYSHAAVMRRAHDMGCKIVPVGIRNVCAEEADFLRESGIVPIMARDCRGSDAWQDDVLRRLGDHVFITVDIDGFDPAYAPGTGTPEPGGLDWYQVTSLLRRVFREKTIVAADIVEVIPVPGQAVTEFLAARLAYKMICYREAITERRRD
jgi:agmatinase